MHEAHYYIRLENQEVKCELCPWNCILKPGQTGNCKVRVNTNGKLETAVFNRVAAMGVDPIEKKPLFHFFPGKNILSIGETGCNLHCKFCQNHNISQCFASDFKGFQPIRSKKIISEALKTWNNIGIAYTYNEPFTFYEFMLKNLKQAHKNGLKNVVVSNGYINQTPLLEALRYIDAINIDLKAFTDNFYTKYTSGKLEPVLECLKIIVQSNTHLEITNLVIPGLNDNEEEFTRMVKWIKSELGCQIPLHISRYFPQHKFNISPTPVKTLETFYALAKEQLQHVYLGNVSDEKRTTTYCPNCHEILIKRNRYRAELANLSKTGNCLTCKSEANIIL